MFEVIWNLPPASAIALWTTISAFVLPLFVSLAKQHTWTSTQKSVAAIVLSLVGALLTLYGTGQLNGPIDVAALGLLIFAASRQVYEGIYEKFGVDAAINPWKQEVVPPVDAPVA